MRATRVAAFCVLFAVCRAQLGDSDIDKVLDDDDLDYDQEEIFKASQGSVSINGAARQHESLVRLTPWRPNGNAGSMFHAFPVDIRSFDGFKSVAVVQFQKLVGCKDGSDGIAFVVQPYNAGFLGNSKNSMGHIGAPENHLALRYDTFFENGPGACDAPGQKPCGVHIAIWRNGNFERYSDKAKDLRDGREHSFIIRYTKKRDEYQVWLDREAEYRASDVGMASIIGGGGSNGVFLGWTGGTGGTTNDGDGTGCSEGDGASQDQDILKWRVLSLELKPVAAALALWFDDNGDPTIFTYALIVALLGLCAFSAYFKTWAREFSKKQKEKKKKKKAALRAEADDLDHEDETYDPIKATTMAAVEKTGFSSGGSKASKASKGSNGSTFKTSTGIIIGFDSGSSGGRSRSKSKGSKGSRGGKSRKGSKSSKGSRGSRGRSGSKNSRK